MDWRSIGAEEFAALARSFCARSQQPSWAWNAGSAEGPFAPRPGYLRSSPLFVPAPRSAHSTEAAAEAAEAAELSQLEDPSAQAADDVCEAPTSPHTAPHLLELHIMYSATYRMPMLALLGTSPSGVPWSAEDVHQYLSSCGDGRLPPGFVTQVEHAALATPCFAVHPCRTADLMETLGSRRSLEASLQAPPPSVSIEGVGNGAAAGGARSATEVLDLLTAWWAVMAPLVGVRHGLSDVVQSKRPG